MKKSRKQAVTRLIRSTYMQPDQIDVFIEAFSKQAPLMGKKIKSGDELAAAVEWAKSDAFIESIGLNFGALSVEEMNVIKGTQ